MTEKDKTLLKIANTIIANLGNTTGIGLMNGKIGICLFLFEYARYSKIEYYEEIAYDLLEYEFKKIANNLRENTINAICEVGIGLTKILNENYVTGDDMTILNKIDKFIANTSFVTMNAFAEEKNNVHVLPILYFLYRIVYNNKSAKELDMLIDALIPALEKNKQGLNSQLVINIILVLKIINTYYNSAQIQSTIKKLHATQDTFFIKENNEKYYLHSLFINNKLTDTYDKQSLWWRYIYDFKGNLINKDIDLHLANKIIFDKSHDIDNNKCAIIGLIILRYYEKKNEIT